MSTKFFTNEEGRTLIEKIEGIFQHKKIHFLDVLVGYFRASGLRDNQTLANFAVVTFDPKTDMEAYAKGFAIKNIKG